MRPRRWSRAAAALPAALLLAAAGASAQPDTWFDDGPELGRRLLANVVQVRALDLSEHGFGLVVGADGQHVYVATARHVVAGAGGAGRQLEVRFCAGHAGPVPAERVDAFDAAGADVALLRVAQPPGYAPGRRVVAEAAAVALRQPVWLLGQDGQCGVAPAEGAIAALRDARDNLQVEFPGARGGVSGGPALSGHGVIGLVTDADDVVLTVYSIERLAQQLRATAGWWGLEPARNVPLTDPRSAEIDLSETLNHYLFGVRNLQQLLLQPQVPRPRYVAFANDYGAAINRFRDARERHDGTLLRHWPPAVLARWQRLREELWQVHQPFWALNGGDSQRIFDQQRAPVEVQAQMRALEPALVQLQAGIADFLQALGQRSAP